MTPRHDDSTRPRSVHAALLLSGVPSACIQAFDTHEDWEQSRNSEPRIGGSDVAHLFYRDGKPIAPWESSGQWSVWARCRGLEWRKTGRHLSLGHLFEEAILQAHAYLEGYRVLTTKAQPLIVRHPEIPWACFSPDGLATDGERRWLVDAKRPMRADTYREWPWADSVTDLATEQEDFGGVPPYYVTQGIWAQAIMRALTGEPWGFSFVVERYEVTSHYLEPCEELETAVVAHVRAWYEHHVEGGNPPPIDHTEPCSRWVAAEHVPGKAEVELDGEGVELLGEWMTHAAAKKRHDIERKRLSNLILSRHSGAGRLLIEGEKAATIVTPKGRPPYLKGA